MKLRRLYQVHWTPSTWLIIQNLWLATFLIIGVMEEHEKHWWALGVIVVVALLQVFKILRRWAYWSTRTDPGKLNDLALADYLRGAQQHLEDKQINEAVVLITAVATALEIRGRNDVDEA